MIKANSGSKYFRWLVSALCLSLICMVAYVFYTLTVFRDIPPQPYVAIVNNNIGAKTKILLTLNELQTYLTAPTPKALTKLKFKARVQKSSILQDLRSPRTKAVHEQFGDLKQLDGLINQLSIAYDGIKSIKPNEPEHQQIQAAIKQLDKSYREMNNYLSLFISRVQQQQMVYSNQKDEFYTTQYLYLGIIIAITFAITLVVSYLYLTQIKLTRNLEMQKVQIEESRNKANESAKAKSQFLANISHEMRTPLNAIIGLSHTNLHDGANQQTKNYISMIHDAGNHLLNLINNVLDLSKIERNALQIDNHEFELKQLVESTRSVFLNIDEKENVDILITVPKTHYFTIESDLTKLSQIINNIGYNAFKFTSHGKVEVTIEIQETPNESLTITVADTGIGMTKEQLEIVFNEFTQADNSTTRKFGGTGLGLSITQSLVDLLSGEISISSEHGVGTQISITVPIRILDRHPLIATNHTIKPVNVISDNASMRQAIIDDLVRLDLYDQEAFSAIYYHDYSSDIERKTEQLKHKYGDAFIALCNIKQQALIPDVATLPKPYDLYSLLDGLQVDSSSESTHSDSDLNTIRELKVLLVEDIKLNQIVAEKTLEQMQLTATTVENGQECLDELKLNHYDLILMDIQMPVMDGVEALKHIQQGSLAERSVIIALTANVFQSDVNHYLQLGFHDVIPKPFQLESMRETLIKHLGNKMLHS
ncbi:response regulator [Vibrio sp. SCSIO 43135]|uniref:ATP-binding protein n=1 Tax=Vibrio sp. SCSIO 43135 TaxID=2819096 RepID=UPI0020763359|nr:ATP-binding protein [Vibrio sp. SCSIO 43135]USD43000.1 response regulator [Vibrio sp. SCSIO 43135]